MIISLIIKELTIQTIKAVVVSSQEQDTKEICMGWITIF